MNSHLSHLVNIALFFTLSLIVSSLLIRKGIPLLSRHKPANPDLKGGWQRDLGFWIGFFEHLIIFILVINKRFEALAIIIGAKEFVRKEDIKANPAYYLLGTLINFGVALVIAEILQMVLRYT